MSVFLLTSQRNAMRALASQGIFATDCHAQVSSIIAQHLSPAHAALIAEPQHDPGQQRIDWYAYASDGTKTLAMSTYHNVDDGWYLRLPDSWRDQILITRTAGAEASTVTFSIQGDGTEPPRDFLRITKLTGSNREVQATRAGRIILRRQPEIIYTAELLEANSGWEYGLTEDEVREAFNLITTEWTAGDS